MMNRRGPEIGTTCPFGSFILDTSTRRMARQGPSVHVPAVPRGRSGSVTYRKSPDSGRRSWPLPGKGTPPRREGAPQPAGRHAIIATVGPAVPDPWWFMSDIPPVYVHLLPSLIPPGA